MMEDYEQSMPPAGELYERPFASEDSLREEVESAVTLMPDAYSSPEFFVREQEKYSLPVGSPVGCIANLRVPGE